MEASPDDVFELGRRKRSAVRKTPLFGMPDHYTFLVSLRQVEAMTFQDCPRPVKLAARCDGVGNLAYRQQLERLTRVIRYRRLPIEQRSIELEYYEFHC